MSSSFSMIVSIHFILLIVIFSCQGQSSPKLSLDFKMGITTILEDSKKNLWIGSKEEGLCRFDGATYVYFSKEDGLPNSSIRDIQEDKEGNIWLIAGSGLYKYDGIIFSKISIRGDEHVEGNLEMTTNLFDIEEDDLWFNLGSKGIWRYRDGLFDRLEIPVSKWDRDYAAERFDKPYHFPYSVITSYKDKTGKLWLGTFNRGVVGYDGESFEYHNPDKFGIGTIRSIFQDNSGDFWFGSNGGGLYKYDGKRLENFTAKQGLTSSNPGYDEAGTLSRVWSIEQDESGNMWFGTVDSGLWTYDGKNMTNYSVEDGLPSNFVESIYKDNRGLLWFISGLDSHGILYTFDGEFIRVVNK